MAQTIHNPHIIRGWRKALGLSQEQLATDVDVKRQYINRLEAGKYASLPILGKIARRCEQNIREALTAEGVKELEKLTSLLD